ncbi:MAG: TldD/PmbA family protein [Cyclobacteriaceae bacterium]
MSFRPFYSSLIFLLSITTLSAQSDPLVDIMKEEMNRQYEILSKKTVPAYFISYKASDNHTFNLTSSFGSLVDVNKSRSRSVNVIVRVGDYDLDNSHSSKQGTRFQSRYGGTVPLPLNDNKESIQQSLWLASDLAYKISSESYKMIDKAKESETDRADFSKEEIVEYLEAPISEDSIDLLTMQWSKKMTAWSSSFLDNDDIVEGTVQMRYSYGPQYFISTEGTTIRQNQANAEIQISASIRSEDGNIIPLHKSYFAAKPSDLPLEKNISADIQNMITKLGQLKTAPLAEPYAGPAIFSGSSSGVFFHEIFGHRIEADRLSKNDDSQTFKEKIGQRVLPKFIDVTSDPTLDSYKDYYLSGTYVYDEEGVKSQRVELVEDGILKDFLRSRKPLTKGQKSNGHSRAQTGLSPVSRQSNLIISSEKRVPDEDLRKMLIKACKKQKASFGLYIKSVAGGYTMTDRYRPNAFSITPTEVYKIYADGRPDELVRGVDLIGTPLTMFSEIQATGNSDEIFYGYCGAESGYIPVTATAPAIFVRKIETQKRLERNIDEPILEDPNFHIEK